MAIKITTGEQELLLFIGEGNRGPYFVTGHYPFLAVEDLDAAYQGHADRILRDVLGRIENCAMEGASISYIADEDVPEKDRPAGLTPHANAAVGGQG
jgi:hypothetical protein